MFLLGIGDIIENTFKITSPIAVGPLGVLIPRLGITLRLVLGCGLGAGSRDCLLVFK